MQVGYSPLQYIVTRNNVTTTVKLEKYAPDVGSFKDTDKFREQRMGNNCSIVQKTKKNFK